MANDKARTELAEKVAKHADLSVNAVLRVFYALSDLGVDVTSVSNSLPPSGSTVLRDQQGIASSKKTSATKSSLAASKR